MYNFFLFLVLWVKGKFVSCKRTNILFYPTENDRLWVNKQTATALKIQTHMIWFEKKMEWKKFTTVYICSTYTEWNGDGKLFLIQFHCLIRVLCRFLFCSCSLNIQIPRVTLMTVCHDIKMSWANIPTTKVRRKKMKFYSHSHEIVSQYFFSGRISYTNKNYFVGGWIYHHLSALY